MADTHVAMHSGHILQRLVNHFNWRINRMMPEFEVDGGRADLAFVTPAGYLTEIEIKTSLVDFRRDAAKRKWAKPRPHVARFFFAVPEPLVASILPLLPEGAGLIACGEYTREVRAAKRRPAAKLTEHQRRAISDAAYFRYWEWRCRVDLPYRARLDAEVITP